jgi:serine protease AprX
MTGDRKLIKRRGLVLAAIVLIAAFLPFTFTAKPSTVAAEMHPALVQMIDASPDQTVRLVVQNIDHTSQAQSLAQALGGDIIHEFEFLNAFVVELPAGKALELAHSSFVARISLDGEVKMAESDDDELEDANNTYVWSTNTDLASAKFNVSGQGIGVAVIDSGIDSTHPCLDVAVAPFGGGDDYGHGTHVAGIIACNSGNFQGMAPDVDLIDLRIFDAEGNAYESDVVAALEWIYFNKDTYNIRVVNMSLNSGYEASYHESYMNAAAELLWFNGVVVVVSAGNKGPLGGANTVNTAPANDPFFIAVGASDEHDTYYRGNDTYAPFSAAGVTDLGHQKPDVVAPGYNIISAMSSGSDWDVDYPEKMVGTNYVRMSGTSMSAPVVSGAVALLLEWMPDLTPDQVKYLLMNTGSTIYKDNEYAFAYLDLYHLLLNTDYWTSFPAANTGEYINELLFTGDQEAWNSVAWNSVAWNSVAWNSVAWNSVAWNSVAWNSVAWNSVAWNSVAWNSIYLEGGIFWGKTRNLNAQPLEVGEHDAPDYGEISNDPFEAEPINTEQSTTKGPKK